MRTSPSADATSAPAGACSTAKSVVHVGGPAAGTTAPDSSVSGAAGRGEAAASEAAAEAGRGGRVAEGARGGAVAEGARAGGARRFSRTLGPVAGVAAEAGMVAAGKRRMSCRRIIGAAGAGRGGGAGGGGGGGGVAAG